MADGAASNPTGVNSFNGISDEGKTAAAFESLWQRGAADSQNPKEAAQLRTERETEKTVEAPVRETEAKVAPESKAEEPAEEGPEYQSLEEYLTKANIDPESFYQLPWTAKVNGKDEPVKLADLRKSYQQEADYTRKTQTLSEERRTWEQQHTQARQAAADHLQRAETLGNLAYQQVLHEFQNVNWEHLKASDPTQWAVRNTELNQRAAAVQQYLGQIQSQRQQLIAQALPQERERMLAAEPAWRDEKKFAVAKEAINKYAPTRGVTEAELGNLSDHRFMLILHDASRAAALQAELTELKGKIAGKVQQVRAAPPAPVAGTRTTRDPKVVAYQSARERLRANPRDESAQAAAFDALASRLG
jgi:hypothetical protein